MLKNLLCLEHIVADKVIHLVLENDTPIPAIKDALFRFSAYVQQVEDQFKAKQEQASKVAEEKKEEVKDVQSAV